MRLAYRSVLASLAIASSIMDAQTMTMQQSPNALVRVGSGQVIVLKQADGSVMVEQFLIDSGAKPIEQIQIGDRIVRVGTKRNLSMEGILQEIGTVEVGSVVNLGFVRGSAAEQEFRFDRQPRPQGATMAVTAGSGTGTGAWTQSGGGSADAFSIAGAVITENSQGMPEVTHRGTHAASAAVNLRVGDVITGINGAPISALLGLTMPYQRLTAGAAVRLNVQRGAETLVVSFAKPSN